MAKKKKGSELIANKLRGVVNTKQPANKTTNLTGRTLIANKLQSATKKAEEERSSRMRQGLSSVVRSSFNRQMSQPTRVQKSTLKPLAVNALAPVKSTAQQTRSQQSKYLNTDLQRKGLNTPMSQLMAGKTNVGVEQGKALRAGMPTNSNVIESWRRTASDAERNARQKYGYDKDFAQKQITERLDNSGRKEVFDPSNGQITTALPARLNTVAPNEVTYKAGDALRGMRLDDIRAGFADAFARKNVEDTAQRQYGITVDDDTQARLNAQRETLGYGTGMAAGQMTQYALTRGALSGLGLVGRGAKAADTAGKAFRAEMAIDQAASVPLNLIDAMKEDNIEGIVKRFGLNQGLDLVFGAFTEGISIKRNPLYQNAETKHIAAKEARQAGDNATANALDQSARRDLGAISNAELDEARNDIVARVGEQRRIVNDANVDAIQNANGISAGTLNGADALDNIDNRAVRSIENMGYESDIPAQSISQPSESIVQRRFTPQSAEQSARVQNALGTIDQYGGLDRMLRTADDTDRLIRTFQDPAFNDVDMLEGVANNLFPEGKMRSIRIDAERAYSNDVRAFDADPESFDFIQPVREDYYIDMLSKEVVDELQRSRNVRDIIPQLANDLGVSEDELLDALRRTEGEFYGFTPSEGVRNARNVVKSSQTPNYGAIADARNVYQNAVNYYDDLLQDLESSGAVSRETIQWLRTRRNTLDKARLKAGKSLDDAGTYVDRLAKDIDYVRNRINKTDGYDIFDRHSVGKAQQEIREALSAMDERLPQVNGRRRPKQAVSKEMPEVAEKTESVRRPIRDIKEGDVSSSLLRNLGYDGIDEVRRTAPAGQTARATEKSAEAPKAKAEEPKAEPKADRSKEAWDNIESITDKNNEPEDLMRKRPTRNEPAIPKASDQKARKEVLFRGETKETAEQAAQEAPKRRQVKGILNEEQPKTEYSEMSLHDLQAERHSLEEQVRYDKTGRVDNKIYEIDEEFKRRGKEPNWFAVEPEEGGKRVRSPREQDAEVERLKKKYGEFKNGLNKKIETDEGVRRNLKTLDTILPEASPEVDHIVTNNMLDGKYAIDDGRTTKDILTEVKANMAENPEAYTNKVVNFDETVDARERIVALETAQAYWKEIGNTEYELKATEALSKYVSESASILKIHGILRKLSKPARMDYLDQTIAKLEKRFEKRLKRAKIEHIRVSDETRKMLKEAKTDEQTKEAWTRASLEIWSQIPASVKEKMDFIRVNAMLLNPKTHIRNFLGNAIFLPLREAKNITGTGLEYLAMKAGILDPSNRTKAIIPYKEGMDYADTVLKDMGDELRGANRYFEDIANDRPFDVDVFMAGRQNGNPFINGIRKATDKIGNFNAWALEHEDFLFFNGAFKEHFGRVMKARKLTVKDLENNPALRNDIIETATEEALRATYRDESAAARIISRWKNPGEKAHITRKIIGVALDAILPFTKTPINILRRAVDYSPVGFPKGAYNFLSGWHSGDQKQVVKGLDQLASAIPGSGLAILGWFMAERDGVTGNLGAEKDDQFMRDLGKQKFSVVFHSGTDKEWSYTLDWAAPGCIPFFTGVAYKEWSDGSFDFWEVADTFEKMFEPTMEMSVMQGIKNTAETFQRASDGGVWQGLFSVGVNTGLQYAGQFKPTLVSQTARFIDPVRRDTTSTADTALQRQVERWWNKQKAGIPSTPLTNNSLYNISSKSLNPYQNVWGDEENNTYNDGTVMRAIENFLSPGYAKKYKADDVDKEILSIYKQDPSAEGVIPTKFSKYEIGFDGGTVRFSNDDRANFIKVQGKVSKQDLRKIFDSEEYNNASLTNKQKMIANAYADAKGEAKRDTLLKMGKDEWKVYTDDFDDDSRKKDYSDAKDAGLKADQYYELMTTKDWDLDESGKPVKSELAMYLNDQDLTDAQRAVIFSKLANSNTKNPYEDGTAHTTDWQSEYDNYLAKKNKGSSGSSGSSGSKKRRSGRSGSSGGGSKKARAKTDSEKRFAALQTGKAPTNAKGIEALSSVKGLSKSQKKALVKLLKKRLEV